MKQLTYIEIDAPAQAAFGVPATTYRFAEPTDYLPGGIAAIASIRSVSYTASRISLGIDLGQRATLQVAFTDHRHIFAAEPFAQGTFWGKWRARYGQRLRGAPIRWVQGLLGQSLAEMEIRHFIIESTDGPDTDGTYTISAKDILKLADGDRAQAPLLSRGFLVGSLDTAATSFTLSPVGIGAADYGSSGFVAIGGAEIVSYTRSGDVMTIVRGQLGTLASAHQAGDRVQRVLTYTGADPADIIADLLITYAGVPASNIPLSTWKTETASFLGRLYSSVIAEPVSVNTLISELVEQAALAIWWEPLTQLLKLQVLRSISTTAARFTEDNTLEGSLRVKDQPGTRLSEVWTYFGQRNALRPVDEADNFRSVAVSADLAAETEYGAAVIKKIFSRWIPFGGRQVALRLNDIQLSRFRDPPRKFSLELFRYGPESPQLGGGYRLESWTLQNMAGARVDAPIQITSLNPMADRYQIEAEEALFKTVDPLDLANRTIIIDSTINNVNVRAMHDSIYPAPTGLEAPPVTLTVYVEPSVIVGSSGVASPAFDVGSWPVGITVKIVVRGDIRGAGGAGGVGGNASGSNGGSPLNGYAGGAAIYTRYPITLQDATGKLYGGGGGGGGGGIRGGGGGGGAGVVPGAGGPVGTSTDSPSEGNPGTQDAGGDGGDGGGSADLDGGAGGNPGQVGNDGQSSSSAGLFGGNGGAAGAAIDGISFITQVGAVGDRRGGQVN